MVDHDDDEGQEAATGQAPPAPTPAKWDPLAADAAPSTAEPLGEGERVAKALARAGVASRREVERYIAAGRVALNGKVLETPAVKVAPGDILTVDGAVVGGPEPTRLFRYHKPAGLITTNSDPQGRPTVFEHLPEGLPRVLAVGRLDLNTEGLLLLTNDGALSRALELPASGWVRRYRARAHGRIDQARLDTLKDGVTVDGVSYGPIEARLDKATGHDRATGAANVWISVAITEGKNREVRRVLEHLGLKVNRLIRLAYGPFALGTLEAGQVEEVGPRVIREQLAEHVAPQNLPTGDRAEGGLFEAAPGSPRSAPRADAPRRGGGSPIGERSSGRTSSGVAKRTGAPLRREGAGRPPADGAERRLAEAPRKGGRPSSSGKTARPLRGWVDKPAAAAGKTERTRGDRPRTTARNDDRPTRSADDRGFKPRGPKTERSGAAQAEGRPAASGFKSLAKPTGKAAPKSGAKPGSKPAGKPAAGAPARTGLELTPPMRRTPRGSGPRRPPRKD